LVFRHSYRILVHLYDVQFSFFSYRIPILSLMLNKLVDKALTQTFNQHIFQYIGHTLKLIS
jgi:hypothetical protein